MHSGRFKLDKTTLAMGEVNGKRVAVRIPAGDIVKLIADPSPGNKMADVLWEGRTVAMYATDLKQRGIEAQKHWDLTPLDRLKPLATAPSNLHAAIQGLVWMEGC